MSLIMESHDSLPYVDADATPHDRDNISRLIAAELPRGYQKSLHPSLAPLLEPKFSELFQQELDRRAAGQPTQDGIDLARYEEPEQPEESSEVDLWRSSLRSAYASKSYLAGRLVNLDLLEEFGKNAWLISNSQMEDILRNLEKELSDCKSEIENVNKARKTAQEGSKAELSGLEEMWRVGVGRIIEVQVATDGVNREIRDRTGPHNGR